MPTRHKLLPEPALADLKSDLWERMSRIGDELHAAQFGRLIDPLLRQLLEQGFKEAAADEGTVWLVDAAEEFLEPAFNTGRQAERIVGQFKQPLNSGLISMVFASEQSFLENDVARNTQQSKLLDTQLSIKTHALIAVPFHFLNACRGVVSCVQLKPNDPQSPQPPGFQTAHLATVQRTTALLAQLVEHRLLKLDL
ncbi:MAG TPA: GAF domain-containing protein [Verrucomicrobiae bacterium]|nr:GAF domain-containing protein [Verrucomicrobiae bacterium]